MKATRATVQRRVEEVLRIRLDGAAFWDVREYAREKEQEEGSPWFLSEGGKPLSDGQLWRYIAQADKLAAKNFRASRKKMLRRHLLRRENLFGKCCVSGDYRTALAVLRDLAELEGLYPPRKIAPTNPAGDQPYDPLSDEERLAALAEIHARMDEGHGGASAQGQDDPGRPLLGGPDRDPHPGGNPTRPVAGGPPDEPLPEGPAPMF
jgi:hypothetical protein